MAMDAIVLLTSLIPSLRTRFLAYGPRAVSSSPNGKNAAQKHPSADLLDRLAAVTVPHAWFASFYSVSMICLTFWAQQILSKGVLFQAVAQWTGDIQYSMTPKQILVAWLMLFAQASRRLYECLALSCPSESRMWVGHWVVGVLFYIGTSMAVWIEGIPALTSHTFTLHDLAISAPDIRTFISTILFLLASGFQHDCHAYLFSLKASNTSSTGKTTYKIPEHPAFGSLIAPHYTAECVIYFAVALMATPQGAWYNWTMASALVFVVVNLGVTADGTREWYKSKFGEEAVEGKWRMVPGVW